MNLRLVVNLSLDWVPVLTDAGIPAVHWTQVGDSSAPDQAIMSWAAANGYAVFSHDLDFSTMLAEFWGQTTITCRTAPNSRRGRGTTTRKIPARLSGAQLFVVRPHLPRPHLRP